MWLAVGVVEREVGKHAAHGLAFPTLNGGRQALHDAGLHEARIPLLSQCYHLLAFHHAVIRGKQKGGELHVAVFGAGLAGEGGEGLFGGLIFAVHALFVGFRHLALGT